eukprot:15366341-Ditylum_brightwellii.AAC.1
MGIVPSIPMPAPTDPAPTSVITRNNINPNNNNNQNKHQGNMTYMNMLNHSKDWIGLTADIHVVIEQNQKKTEQPSLS